MKTLPPSSIIGILGGGQLGRMTALAAAKLGYRCHIFCSDAQEPAVEVSAFHTHASFDDTRALKAFAKSVDVVTLEWENVPIAALETISLLVPTYPAPKILKVAQDRGEEKNFARSIGLGTADFALVSSAAELQEARGRFGCPAILKSTRMGYDGKGQVALTPELSSEESWRLMGSGAGILESFVNFASEVSVVVAARADGTMAVFPAVQNIHRNHILAETHAPAGVSASIAHEAEQAARLMAEKLGVVGLLAVEFFVLRAPDALGRQVWVNEIAPRPHNSGHWTMDACPTSQFEQLVRAVCGLPLGAVTPHSRAVMQNLIGDDFHAWPDLLAQSSACLHVYGKTEVRPGRKMGHVTFLKGAWEGG